MGVRWDEHSLRAALVHRIGVDDVLEVFADVWLSVAAQLLDYLQAVHEGAVRTRRARLPLPYPYRVVYVAAGKQRLLKTLRDD